MRRQRIRPTWGGPRGLLVVVLAAMMASCVVAATASAFALQRFASGVSPSSLALSPQGDLWFTDTDGGSVGRIDAKRGVTRLRTWARADGEPFAITRGAGGAMWFIDWRGRWLGRGDAGGGITIFPTGVKSDELFVTGLAAGPDNAVWFGSDLRIGRTTTDGRTDWYPLANPEAGLSAPATGPDGRVWFATDSAVLAVGSGGVMTRYAVPGMQYGGVIAAGADGRMWVVAGTGIWTVSTSGVARRISSRSLERTSYGAPALRAGPGGHMWLSMGYAGKVAEISQAGRVTLHGPGVERIVTDHAFLPGALALDTDKSLFVAGDGVQRVVLRPSCVVPDVVLRTEQTARARLKAAGCGVRVVRRSHGGPVRVVGQKIKAGRLLSPHARVTITLGRLPRACRFPEGASIVARSADVQVAVRTVRSPPLTTDSRMTRTWWTCLTAQAKVRRLDSEQDEEPFSFVRDLGPFAIAGTRLTYAVDRQYSHYGDGATDVVTRDLDSGDPAATFQAGSTEPFGGPGYWITEIATNRAGDIAWIANDHQVEVRTAAGARNVLASGTVSSVTIDDTTVRWTQDGTQRSAPINQ